MKFTVGKLVWGISILIFLSFAYGHSMFARIQSIFDGTGSTETHVQSYVSQPQVKAGSARGDSDAEGSEVALGAVGSSGLGDILGGVGGMTEESDAETYMEIELLKYRVQELEEDYEKIKVEIKEAHKEKNDSMDNLLAIMTTLLPIAIPYFTRKNHDKEITFKKEVKK